MSVVVCISVKDGKKKEEVEKLCEFKTKTEAKEFVNTILGTLFDSDLFDDQLDEIDSLLSYNYGIYLDINEILVKDRIELMLLSLSKQFVKPEEEWKVCENPDCGRYYDVYTEKAKKVLQKLGADIWPTHGKLCNECSVVLEDLVKMANLKLCKK